MTWCTFLTYLNTQNTRYRIFQNTFPTLYTAKNAQVVPSWYRQAWTNVNVVRPTMNKLSTMLFQVVTVEQCCNSMLTILFLVGRTTLFVPCSQQVVDFLNFYACTRCTAIIRLGSAVAKFLKLYIQYGDLQNRTRKWNVYISFKKFVQMTTILNSEEQL
jgi:hypothetical protein